jgi:hypothetical protein
MQNVSPGRVNSCVQPTSTAISTIRTVRFTIVDRGT